MPSKNKKKYWRKIQKTKEAEDYLFQVNEEFKYGGSVASRPDSQLYTISKRPSDPTNPPPPKILKSWHAFYPDPLVKPLSGRDPPADKGNIIRPIDAKLRKTALGIKQGRIQVRRGKRKSMAKQWEMFTSPLWSDKDTTPANIDTSDFTQHVTELVRPYTPRIPHTVASGRADKKGNPLLPAVQIPHPGISYRPGEEEHKSLMERVGKGGKRRARAERKLKNKLKGMRTVSREALRREELRQMEEGLFGRGEVSENENDDKTGNDTQAVVTKAKRRKNKRKGLALEKKNTEIELRRRKLQARQSQDIQNIKSLNRQLDKLSDGKKEKSVPLTRRLGRLRYREEKRDFQASSKISNSLCELVTEGDLLRDRYKSLQKRNIIEVRRRRTVRRKYALKAYVKNSYKDRD